MTTRQIFHMRFNRVFPHTDKHRNSVLEDPQKWIERAKIYERTTRRSLLNQTDKNFEVWAVFNMDQIMKHKHVEELAEYFRDEPGVEVKVEVGPNLTKSFIPVEAACEDRYQEYDYLNLINLDCDDMYIDDLVERYNEMDLSRYTSTYMARGYYFDITDGRMAYHNANGSPGPFWSLIIPKRMRQDIDRCYQYLIQNRMSGEHFQMNRTADSLRLDDGLYVQVIHGNNTTTSWENRDTQKHMGESISSELRRNKILKRFGVRYEYSQTSHA